MISATMPSAIADPSRGIDIRNYLDAAELRALYVRRPWRLVRDGVGIWLAILLAFAGAVLSGNVWISLVAFVVIAGRQHALNNMVHEASHYLLARDKTMNDLISDAFFATPHLITTEGYRAKHLAHHAHLGHPPEDDEFKARYLLRGWRFFWRSIWVLLGASSILTAATYGKGYASGGAGLRAKALIVLTNGALLGYCWFLGSAAAYLYLWLLPLVTLTGYLATLRVVAEHQPVAYAQLPNEDFETPLEPPITRSIPAGPLARFFLAPLNFCYHFEHHALPAVPYPSLPHLHRILEERGFFKTNPEVLGQAYGAVLASLVRPPHPGPGQTKG